MRVAAKDALRNTCSLIKHFCLLLSSAMTSKANMKLAQPPEQ
jgi:hypothetical protein